MSQGYTALTEKEKQTLRLIVRGHDAKSIARHFGLSVHTVNERLRDARRKMSVSSSREAARLVLDREGAVPDSLGDRRLGEAEPARAMSEDTTPIDGRKAKHRFVWAFTGVVMMSLMILATLALSSLTPTAEPPEKATATAAVESDVVRLARDWLELGDQGRWSDGWHATSASFRQHNSVEKWTEVSEAVRVPLGTVVSRTAMSQESVPAPPAGVEVVKFRTSFANKANVTETVSLAREDGRWVVVGIYID